MISIHRKPLPVLGFTLYNRLKVNAVAGFTEKMGFFCFTAKGYF